MSNSQRHVNRNNLHSHIHISLQLIACLTIVIWSSSCYISHGIGFHILHNRGAKQGGVGGSQPPLNFGWGVEHLSTPPDFAKKVLGGLPLN